MFLSPKNVVLCSSVKSILYFFQLLRCEFIFQTLFVVIPRFILYSVAFNNIFHCYSHASLPLHLYNAHFILRFPLWWRNFLIPLILSELLQLFFLLIFISYLCSWSIFVTVLAVMSVIRFSTFGAKSGTNIV